MRPRRDLHEANRLAWNAATVAHNSHKAGDVEYLRSGGSTLFPEELDLLGDLSRRRLLHLQCNSGHDTLSLAGQGARVTGVDIGDEAIAYARRLSQASGIPGDFHRADVYDWLEEAAARGERYDLAFCSYGALPWLSDIATWARGVAALLAPGGRLVVVEFHPTLWVLDEGWRPRYDYFCRGVPLTLEGVSDYVGDAGDAMVPWGAAPGVERFTNPHLDHTFSWSVSEVVTAILDAGLALEALREWPYANAWNGFERMRPLPGRRWLPPADLPELPLMLGLSARR